MKKALLDLLRLNKLSVDVTPRRINIGADGLVAVLVAALLTLVVVVSFFV